eukprot:TRINITY_DN5976_c0_g1_i4.p1 TRINITY_DN5976_c0_g1~~TRINITY_DN5976_c0_g1_i4.p1  ORF type:complete len:159 (-),score=51.02 TRINITY_DN5976_c0_g1_i4:94-570(-)
MCIRDRSEDILKQTYSKSTYNMEFGYLKKDLRPQNNIFKYKKCSEMDFATPLNTLAAQFVDNWIELNDELEFQEMVLACLRALYARVKANQVKKSEFSTQYAWKNIDWNLCKPERVDKLGAELKQPKINYNSIFKQRLKDEQLRDCLLYTSPSPRDQA